MKLVDKLDAIPLELIVQHELEEIESEQGESYGENEIVSQYWIHGRIPLLRIEESIRDETTYYTTHLIEEE